MTTLKNPQRPFYGNQYRKERRSPTELAAQHAKRTRERNQEFKRLELCPAHPDRSTNGKSRCDECLEQNRRNRKALTAARRAAGVCVQCGRNPAAKRTIAPGRDNGHERFGSCFDCRQRDAESAQRQRDKKKRRAA